MGLGLPRGDHNKRRSDGRVTFVTSLRFVQQGIRIRLVSRSASGISSLNSNTQVAMRSKFISNAPIDKRLSFVGKNFEYNYQRFVKIFKLCYR